MVFRPVSTLRSKIHGSAWAFMPPNEPLHRAPAGPVMHEGPPGTFFGYRSIRSALPVLPAKGRSF